MWGRRRRDRSPLPPNWRELTATALAHWAVLDDDERDHLGGLMADIASRRWEAANGFALTDEIRVVIAAQAALLILGLDVDCYRDVTAIVVHPTTVTLHGERAGPAPGLRTDAPVTIVGQTHDRRGPVLIAWDAARAGARHPERGFNVVLHEFAHKLDMLDGMVDGTPPLPDAAARRRWVEVCTAEYRRLRSGEGAPALRGYAAVNPGEFFAVATEVFFDRPADLGEANPDLYDVLRAFYRQDPAARAARPLRR
ncbi:MAG: zinc-dependent peptidase [Acidimicrobiales bacterium]|nr:zinc-dependent peptidase [Acidimicrobiales bacterium]